MWAVLVGDTAQCKWSLIMHALASCVRCITYLVRDSCFNNILFFYNTPAAGCSQSYHAKILANTGNTCNLLLGFMLHGEHTVSQVHILHYLPTSFCMYFWDLTSICEKLRPGCLGSDFFYPHLHQYNCAGRSLWLVQELKFEVFWNKSFFLSIHHVTLGFHWRRILSLASRAGLLEKVVFGCPGILQNCKDFCEIDDKVRKWCFYLLKYICKRQVLVVWKNASKYMTK